MRSGWVPLSVQSNYTFLTGASHPEELVRAAIRLGLTGIAITDQDSLSGVVQARQAIRHAREDPEPLLSDTAEFRLVIGARVTVESVVSLLLLAINREGYGNLGELISRGRLRSPKGESCVSVDEVRAAAPGLVLIVTEETQHPELVLPAFEGRSWVGIARHFRPEERGIEKRLLSCATSYALPVAATPRILYHETSRRRLQDALCCIHHGVRIDEAGTLLLPNGSFGLVSPATMAQRYSDHPEWLAESEKIARRVSFDLAQLEYRYPGVRGVDLQGEGIVLRRRVTEGARHRYPEGVPPEVSRQLERELSLIGELKYGGYFLTMTEIVDFCRSKGILCQGRGSAANSAVCFCLGITAVDPVKMNLLFERFISRERAEPPDIDLDIEHRRREEVIQYVYEHYGREYAAMVANTVRFRRRSAVRELGKVFGFSEVNLDQLAKQLGHHGYAVAEAVSVSGFDPREYRVARFLELVEEIIDTPRHLSIHPGGFLLGQDPIARIVPVENATMEDRTVIQWDKYAVEDMNLFKLDLLGLGALTHLDYAFRLMAEHLGVSLEMAMIPRDCARTFAMLRRAETVGVFQLESRAQMAMLPRMLPRRFYDLVIEISIVRPGPITGGMVHPYLRRRHGEEPIRYPHPDLEPILARTLGVPLFQEQVMKLAVVAADYTPGEADRLRRDMAAWRRHGRIEHHQKRIIERMVAKGIERPFAEQVFEQIRGFGEYGFPESHAASFAQIAYSTAWVRAHYPVIFVCALLNAWPMGFYSPSTIVHDALRAGVAVQPVDLLRSDWECTLEARDSASPSAGRTSAGDTTDGHLAIRLGFRFIRGLGRNDWERIRRARESVTVPESVLRSQSVPRPPGVPRHQSVTSGEGDASSRQESVRRVLRQIGIDRDRAIRLAEAGVFDALGVSRRDAAWIAMGDRVAGNRPPGEIFEVREDTPAFRHLREFERLAWDYRATGQSTAAHPLEPYREWLMQRAYPTASEVRTTAHDRRISYIGMVICRQRPSTAGGTVFMTLEDETGFVNLIIWKSRYEDMRSVFLTTTILGVRGTVQKSHGVVHLIVEKVWKAELPQGVVTPGSRDFH